MEKKLDEYGLKVEVKYEMEKNMQTMITINSNIKTLYISI